MLHDFTLFASTIFALLLQTGPVFARIPRSLGLEVKLTTGLVLVSALQSSILRRTKRIERAWRLHGKRSSNSIGSVDNRSDQTQCSQVRVRVQSSRTQTCSNQTARQSISVCRRLSCFMCMLRPSEHMVPEAPLVQQPDWLQVNVQPELEMLFEVRPRPTPLHLT